jgi:hypothetical protein
MLRLAALGCAPVALLLLAPALANAQERPAPRREAEPVYPIEVEPHFSFGMQNAYGATGAGAGVRASIPLAYGLLERVRDNLGITFGVDVLRYDECYFPGYCGITSLALPVAAQWNVFLARRISVFAEGGAFVYKGWFDACRAQDLGCTTPSDFGVLPTLAIGGRVHITPNATLLARIGYPMITLGASFL